MRVYLTDITHAVFQQEIDKWLKIAYEQNVVDDFKKRLSGNVTFISLQGVLNEPMVAYFMQNNLGINIRQYSPVTKGSKMADWLFEKASKKIYVEVKTPWEEKKDGTFFYSQYNKLFQTIKNGYKQRPKTNEPYIIFITDELDLTPAIYNDEIEDALYGKRAIVLSNYEQGCFKDSRFDVINRRSLFQQNFLRSLSAIAILEFMVWFNEKKRQDEGKYHFVLYHNPYCLTECRLESAWFEPYRQYVPNFEKGKMEWWNDENRIQ